MKLSSVLVTMTTLVILTACSDTMNESTRKHRQGGAPAVDTTTYEVDAGTAFKDVKNVVIGSFKIGFLEEKKDVPIKLENEKNAEAVSGDVKLTHVDRALMQRITDAAYADFTTRLKKKGYTVTDRNALLKNRDFAHANKQTSPVRKEASFFGSGSTVTYVAPSAHGNLYFVGESGESGGFGFSNPLVAAINYAEETKTQVLFVTYQVDFTDKTGAQKLSIPPGNGIRMIGGKGDTFNTANGTILLGQHIISTASCGEVIDKTDDGKKATKSLSLFKAVLGGGAEKASSFEMKANPEKYRAVSVKLLADANEKLTSKMTSLR